MRPNRCVLPRHSPRCSGQMRQRTHQLARPRLWLSMMGLIDGGGRSGDFNRKTSISTDLLASAAQIVVEFDEVGASGGAGGKSIKKSLKSRQKVEKSSKSSKNLKGLKSCKGHRFGGTFTEAPILRQLDTKNSSFR